MAMAVMTIGVSGVIAMQTVTATSNRHARTLSMATRVAQAWLDQLAAEAGQWNASGELSQTVWLQQVNSAGGAWFRPAYDTTRNFGPAFDALGNPVATDDIATDAHYCTDLQLIWLFDESRGSGLIRANVRVFWFRSSVVALANDPPSHVCELTPDEIDGADGGRLMRMVYLSTAIRQEYIQ